MEKDSNTHRIAKVASELGVGIQIIATILSKNGYVVEAKPTTKISEKMYAIIKRELSGSINDHFITNLTIENFKSVRKLKLECKRINLFIGKPNVGKSNILEGLSLLAEGNNFNDKFNSHIRYNMLHNLYYESETHNPIIIDSDHNTTFIIKNIRSNNYYSVKTDIRSFNSLQSSYTKEKEKLIEEFFKNLKIRLRAGSIETINPKRDVISTLKEVVIPSNLIAHFRNDKDFIISNFEPITSLALFKNDGLLEVDHSNFETESKIKYYKFLENFALKNFYTEELLWPNGNNIVNVLEANKSLRIQLGSIFKEYGYELVINKTTSEIEIQKSVDNIVFKLPLDFVADTLKRFIFHLAAIKSNQYKILIFEEPEAHCFPEYISIISEEIRNSENNQFFVATHSPFIVNDMLDKTPREDLAIHLTYYENYETKVKTLSPEEMSEINDYGIDLFFNLNNYIPSHDK